MGAMVSRLVAGNSTPLCFSSAYTCNKAKILQHLYTNHMLLHTLNKLSILFPASQISHTYVLLMHKTSTYTIYVTDYLIYFSLATTVLMKSYLNIRSQTYVLYY